jgi:hypothetical protein
MDSMDCENRNVMKTGLAFYLEYMDDKANGARAQFKLSLPKQYVGHCTRWAAMAMATMAIGQEGLLGRAV